MKKPWERAPLDEAVFLQEGPGIRSYEYQKGGYPMINVRCVQDGYIDLSTCNAANVELATGKWKHFQVQEGDILFTISGSIGRTAIVTKKDLPLLMNTSVVRFRSKTPRLRDDFFFYYLQSEDFLGKLHALSSGTAQKNVGPTHLKTLDVPLPPLAEQQRIVGLLDEAFEGLATAKANAEKNLQNARSLFESHLQSVFTQRGPGWVEKSLGETCEMYQPKTIGTKDLVQDGPYPVFGANGVIGRYDKFNHEDPQLLVTCRGATCGSVNISEPKSWITGNAMVVRPKDHALDLHFLEFVFRGGIDISAAITGAAQPQITRTNLSPLLIRYPQSFKEQTRLAEKFEDLTEETQRLARLYERKLAALEALKKSLLHQAFTGEL